MREPQEARHYEKLPTPDVRQVAILLWVLASDIRADTEIEPGTTLADFMPGIPKDDSCVGQGFGDYILSQEPARSSGDGYLGYVFVKPLSGSIEDVAPFKSTPDTMDLEWPDVLLFLGAGEGTVPWQINLPELATMQRYELIQGGSFPTNVLIEEFLYPEPYQNLAPEKPLPTVVSFQHGKGNNAMQNHFNALHDTITIPELSENFQPIPGFGTPNAAEALLAEGGQIFPATGMLNWEDHVRFDSQKLVNGYYHRIKITAYAPEQPLPQRKET